MEALPEIGGGDAQPLLDLLRLQLVQLAEEEGVGDPLREPGEAAAEDVPELAGLDLPGSGRLPSAPDRPASGPGRRTAIRPGSGRRVIAGRGLATRPPELIRDLVPQDADQPRPLARSPSERSAGSQHLQERLLDDVRRQLRRPEPHSA